MSGPRVVIVRSSTCPAGILSAHHFRDDATCRCTPGQPPVAAERGMKLLDKHQRSLHPRGQVQALRRKAAIAIGKADRCEEFAHLWDDPAAQRRKAAEYRRRAVDCTEAMVWLNAEHNLGYPVPR